MAVNEDLSLSNEKADCFLALNPLNKALQRARPLPHLGPDGPRKPVPSGRQPMDKDPIGRALCPSSREHPQSPTTVSSTLR
jgi:hypothetical protein